MPDSPRLRRYGSIAALAHVLPPRQLIALWLAIGVTFSSFGFLIDVMASGRSTPLTLNVLFSGVIPAGLFWARFLRGRRTFASTRRRSTGSRATCSRS